MDSASAAKMTASEDIVLLYLVSSEKSGDGAGSRRSATTKNMPLGGRSSLGILVPIYTRLLRWQMDRYGDQEYPSGSIRGRGT